MSSCFGSSQERGSLHDTKSKSIGRVNTFGQIAVKFHKHPHELEDWVENAQRDFTGKCSLRARRDGTAHEKYDIPGPRLHIAIHICGSRGDVQPFIPIAKLLQAPPYGHRVRICTHPAFKEFVESNGLEFFSIGGDPEALMAYMVKNPGLLPGMESIRAGDIAKRRKEMADMFEGTWRSCIETGDGMGTSTTAINVENTDDLFIADLIIANPPSMGHIHCAEKLGIPLHIVFTMPWSPTKVFHHPLAAMDYGEVEKSVANYFSFAMMELLTWQGLGDLVNRFRTHTLKLDPMSPLWGFQLLQRLRVPHSYLWSQTLIPKPSDWPEHLNVTGFSFLKLGSTYTPPDDLLAFLDKGPPPVYIGFGSIVVADPVALTNLIFKAVKLAGVRAILSKGWGGMGTDDVPEDIYMIGNSPHDWLFLRVSCVIHHGGAGTTAAGIALGKPTVVVPFFGDQPFWGQMIAKAGAGPKPVPFKQMTPESLAASITFALQEEVVVAVEKMAAQIANEDGAGGAVRDIEQALNMDEMRCQICPQRLAVWKDKKTGIHLSGMAASILAEKGFIHPKRLRLLRHRHWYTHEGAEFPLVGAVAAAAYFFSTVGTNTSDFSARLKRKPKRVPDQHAALLPITNSEEADQLDDHVNDQSHLSSAQLEKLAMRMAHKIYATDGNDNLNKSPALHGLTRLHAIRASRRVERGRAHQVFSATSHFMGDLIKTGLKTPVAFFYNVANGFRNMPSYTITNEIHRQRDEIVGLGSGVNVASKELILGLYEAFSSLLKHPYLGAKTEGPLGFPKGVGRGMWGFGCHLMAAVWGVPGYTLKGIERALSKHRLTTLQAELYLIRLRQAVSDRERATKQEKENVVERWKALRGVET